MDYYTRKRLFNQEIRTYVLNKENFGKKVSLATLQIRYAQNHGFSKKQLLEALLPYQRTGYVLITNEDLVHIIDRTPKTVKTSTAPGLSSSAQPST